jgi:hypothetical protein
MQFTSSASDQVAQTLRDAGYDVTYRCDAGASVCPNGAVSLNDFKVGAQAPFSMD